MAEARNLRATGDSIERLLEELRSGLRAPEMARVEELVRLVTELYGAGLEHVVGVVVEADDEALTPAAMLRRIVDDELVGSLLVLHGLHPHDLRTRLEQALDHVRPYLASHGGDVELLDVDEAAGAVRLRLVGSCDGCPSSSVTLQLAVEAAIQEAAPEIVSIVADGATEQPATNGTEVPVELTRKVATSPREWAPVYGINRLPVGRLEPLDLEGAAVVCCRAGAELYAYVDRCPACSGALRGGSLDGEVLRCPACAAAYDVRLAGRSLDGARTHLEPVPLLDDGGIVKISLAAAAPA
jgi:Fe-S cluster biogenesis protein NfuA/nitrite reductase/ring-hydroxylating ferredoxin subunit